MGLRCGSFAPALVLLLLTATARPASQQAEPSAARPTVTPSAARELGIKYVRDSAEYVALARQTYRIATDAVTRLAADRRQGDWAVVMDVDETALDNSAYQLERAAYGLPFDPVSWSAWVQRRQAPAIPGAVDFTRAVRRLGGRIAWITNRASADAGATRENLQAAGLWSEDDRLCGQEHDTHTKRARRVEVIAGNGACGWPRLPMTIALFVGDQMSDFPEPDEAPRDGASDAAFGRTFFLLPNPMYGGWTSRVTRPVPP